MCGTCRIITTLYNYSNILLPCNSVTVNISYQWRRPAVNNIWPLGYSLLCFLANQSSAWLSTTYTFSSSNGNFELWYSLVSRGSCHASSKLRLSLLPNKAAPTLHARKMNTNSFTLIHLHRVPSLSDTLRPLCSWWTWLMLGTPGCKLTGGGSVSVGCSIPSLWWLIFFSTSTWSNARGFIPRLPNPASSVWERD